MRHALLFLLLWTVVQATAPAQTIDVSGVWFASDVPYGPWIVRLKQDQTKLSGTVRQSGGPLPQAVNIYEGAIDGSAISFKADSPDKARAITFTGKIDGAEIVLHRATRIITDESQGGNGLFGTKAAPQFTIRRGFSYKGVDIDLSPIQSEPYRDALIDQLRKQIDIVDEAITDPALKVFLKSVPMVMATSTDPGSDRYSSAAKRIDLRARNHDPEQPVILHELMHAYHDQKLPNGMANADIKNLYEQAKASGKFPANSYMLSNDKEYFAMMSSVYLHGSAARDPFTRQAIKEKQPDCYAWLQKEFGPK